MLADGGEPTFALDEAPVARRIRRTEAERDCMPVRAAMSTNAAMVALGIEEERA